MSESQRDMDNVDRMIRHAQKARECTKPVTVRLDCFNKGEAEKMLAWWRKNVPDIQVYATFRSWSNG
jgi:hypothetical protein